MGGKTQGVLDGLVADYNKSQNKYEIKAEFQGTYEESLTKFRTMSATKEAPALVQSSEITTKYMIDSKKITPIDSWIKKISTILQSWKKQLQIIIQLMEKCILCHLIHLHQY